MNTENSLILSLGASRLKPHISLMKSSELGGLLLSMVSSFPHHNTPTLHLLQPQQEGSESSLGNSDKFWIILLKNATSAAKLGPNTGFRDSGKLNGGCLFQWEATTLLQLRSGTKLPCQGVDCSLILPQKETGCCEKPEGERHKISIYKDGALIHIQNNSESLLRALGEDKRLGEGAEEGSGIQLSEA